MAKDGTDHLEPATLLPANNSTTPERVVGTLDLNLGEHSSDTGHSCFTSCHCLVLMSAHHFVQG